MSFANLFFHLVLNFPLLLPSTSISIFLLPTYSIPLLIIWPNHRKLLTYSFLVISTTSLYPVSPYDAARLPKHAHLSLFCYFFFLSWSFSIGHVSVPYNIASPTTALYTLLFNFIFIPLSHSTPDVFVHVPSTLYPMINIHSAIFCHKWA